MSWNISTRLNNLQQQINNIANKGLTNPLEQVMDANSYTLTNLKILDGASNVLQLNTNNVGGITTNASVDVGGNLTCETLNYNELNPPLNPNGITFRLLGENVSETSAGNFTITQFNPYNGIATNQKVLNPTAQLDLSFSLSDASNKFSFGFSTSNTLYPTGGFDAIEYGIFYYPFEGYIYQILNGVKQTGVVYAYTNQTQISILLKVVNGTLKVFINNVEATVLEQPLSGTYYFLATGYMGSSITTTISNCVVNQTFSETLAQVLQNGNDGANQNITGINALTCSTLNYTTLNPPIIESQNLKDVLTTGDDADGLNIENVGTLSGTNINMTGNIFCDAYLEIGDAISNTSQLHLLYGNGTTEGNNFQVIASAGDNLQIQQYKPSGLYNQPLLINDLNYILLKSNNLIYTQDGTNNYYILDANFNTPMYKQVFNNLSGSVGNFGTAGKILMSIPIYTKNNTYNYGIKFGEVLMSNLVMNFTSNSSFPESLTATVYINSDGTSPFDATKGNSIVIPVSNTGGQPTNTFNSTIPIIFYYNDTTQFNKLYIMVAFNKISVNTYTVEVNSLNMVASGYISTNPNGTINFGS